MNLNAAKQTAHSVPIWLSGLIVIKQQLFPIMDNNCGRLFLDCQGMYDFAFEIINFLMAASVLALTLRNCYRLTISGKDPEVEDTRKRKLHINIICAIFLFVLLTEITYSFTAFLSTYSFSQDKLSNSSRQVSIGYKIIQITCVSVLNCLIVKVGQHYWGAVRVYLIDRSITSAERGCISRLYKEPIKKVFIIMYITIAVCVIVSAILLTCAHGVDENVDYTYQNVINFVVTLFSITIFLFARLQCYYFIQRNQQISKKQLKKESLYTLMVFLTCGLRITSYWLAIFNIDPSHTLRNPRMTSGASDCYDDRPYHALYIFGLTIVVNLLPAIIFINIFKATAAKDPSYNQFTTTFSGEDYRSQL